MHGHYNTVELHLSEFRILLFWWFLRAYILTRNAGDWFTTLPVDGIVFCNVN